VRTLIFGVTGFAGRYLSRELVRRGHAVWGAARSADARAASHPVATCGGPLLRCDVGDAAQVRDVVAAARPDAIVILSGLASPPEADRRPAQAYRVHVAGTVNVLETVAELRRPVRVLMVTSSEIYGRAGIERSPLTEDAPLEPTSIYAASKAAADLAAEVFARARGLDVVRVRPFNHTGPGQRVDFVCPDFARQVADIAGGRRAPVIEVGNLDVRRDFSDVRDVVRGYADALVHGHAGEAYNLCAGQPMAVRSILDDLCAIAGVSPEIRTARERYRPAEVPAYWGSAAKAEAALGWRPEIPWRRTLEDLLSWARTGEANPGSSVE
jgi:GDP-4-dehydro-6-deoxy-D-mannose reductase